MFSTTLRWYAGCRSLNIDGLLDAFTADILCNRSVVAFAVDFVDFIDIDNTLLGLVYIMVSTR